MAVVFGNGNGFSQFNNWVNSQSSSITFEDNYDSYRLSSGHLIDNSVWAGYVRNEINLNSFDDVSSFYWRLNDYGLEEGGLFTINKTLTPNAGASSGTADLDLKIRNKVYDGWNIHPSGDEFPTYNDLYRQSSYLFGYGFFNNSNSPWDTIFDDTTVGPAGVPSKDSITGYFSGTQQFAERLLIKPVGSTSGNSYNRIYHPMNTLAMGINNNNQPTGYYFSNPIVYGFEVFYQTENTHIDASSGYSNREHFATGKIVEISSWVHETSTYGSGWEVEDIKSINIGNLSLKMKIQNQTDFSFWNTYISSNNSNTTISSNLAGQMDDFKYEPVSNDFDPEFFDFDDYKG